MLNSKNNIVKSHNIKNMKYGQTKYCYMRKLLNAKRQWLIFIQNQKWYNPYHLCSNLQKQYKENRPNAISENKTNFIRIKKKKKISKQKSRNEEQGVHNTTDISIKTRTPY